MSAVWSPVVVEIAESLQQCIEFLDSCGRVAGVEPFLQRLPEPLDLAAGLGVVRGRVDSAYAQDAQIDFERRLISA